MVNFYFGTFFDNCNFSIFQDGGHCGVGRLPADTAGTFGAPQGVAVSWNNLQEI